MGTLWFRIKEFQILRGGTKFGTPRYPDTKNSKFSTGIRIAALDQRTVESAKFINSTGAQEQYFQVLNLVQSASLPIVVLVL